MISSGPESNTAAVVDEAPSAGSAADRKILEGFYRDQRWSERQTLFPKSRPIVLPGGAISCLGRIDINYNSDTSSNIDAAARLASGLMFSVQVMGCFAEIGGGIAIIQGSAGMAAVGGGAMILNGLDDLVATLGGKRSFKNQTVHDVTGNESMAAAADVAPAIISFGFGAAKLANRVGTRSAAGPVATGVTSIHSVNPIAVADEAGLPIGRSRFPSQEAFRDAVFDRYQQFYDQADAIAQSRVAAGRWQNDPKLIGYRMDAIARARLRSWLASEGIAEGPGEIIQVNRWLRDPSGSGAYRIPDVRVPGANTILDGTIGRKTSATPQIVDFTVFSGGDKVIIVRPTRIGGSYGIIP